MESEKTDIVDIYEGDELVIWAIDDLAFIQVVGNGLTFNLPLEELPELLDEFVKAKLTLMMSDRKN